MIWAWSISPLNWELNHCLNSFFSPVRATFSIYSAAFFQPVSQVQPLLNRQ